MTNLVFEMGRRGARQGPSDPVQRLADPLKGWQFDLRFLINDMNLLD